MEKRPLSLTIIAWLLIVFTLLGLYGVVTMGSNPVAAKMLEQMHVSLQFEQAWGVLGAVVNGTRGEDYRAHYAEAYATELSASNK